jgi:hypothetical protein
MSFFLTDEQEDALNLFLDEQNKKVCETQLESETLPDDLKNIIRKTVEAGSPIPAFDPKVGYYSISFTPTEDGNRIYAHHHLSEVSYAICDPLQQVIQEDAEEEALVSETEVIPDDITFVEDKYTKSAIDEVDLMTGKIPDLTPQQIESAFGGPPKELLEELGLESAPSFEYQN